MFQFFREVNPLEYTILQILMRIRTQNIKHFGFRIELKDCMKNAESRCLQINASGKKQSQKKSYNVGKNRNEGPLKSLFPHLKHQKTKTVKAI